MTDYSDSEYSEYSTSSDEEYEPDEDLDTVNVDKRVKRRRRKTRQYYSSDESTSEDSDISDWQPKRRKRKRSFIESDEDSDELSYHRPQKKRRRISKNSNNHSMTEKIYDSLSQHFPKETDIVRSAERLHSVSLPPIESISDFGYLEEFNKEINQSYKQLCCVKQQFEKYAHKLTNENEQNGQEQSKCKKRKNRTQIALEQCEKSIFAIDKKIQSINGKVDALKGEQNSAFHQMMTFKSMAKNHQQSINKEDGRLDALRKNELECDVKQSLIKRIYPIIDALEAECARTRYHIEFKQNELKRNYVKWDNLTVISWFKTLKECTFNRSDVSNSNSLDKGRAFVYGQMKTYNLSGRELDGMNAVFLRYMGINHKSDQKIVLSEIGKLRELMNEKAETEDPFPRCVICRDGIADVVVIPCGHICLCKNCEKRVTKGDDSRCAYCGDQADGFFKTYSYLA